MNCEHKWKNNNGSPNKPCVFFQRYLHLCVTYKRTECLLDSCKFCLETLINLPLDTTTEVNKTKARSETLELRIIYIENKIDKLEQTIESIVKIMIQIENLLKEKYEFHLNSE